MSRLYRPIPFITEMQFIRRNQKFMRDSKAFELFVLNMELHLNAQIEYITPDIKRRTSVCRISKRLQAVKARSLFYILKLNQCLIYKRNIISIDIFASVCRTSACKRIRCHFRNCINKLIHINSVV